MYICVFKFWMDTGHNKRSKCKLCGMPSWVWQTLINKAYPKNHTVKHCRGVTPAIPALWETETAGSCNCANCKRDRVCKTKNKKHTRINLTGYAYSHEINIVATVVEEGTGK